MGLGWSRPLPPTLRRNTRHVCCDCASGRVKGSHPCARSLPRQRDDRRGVVTAQASALHGRPAQQLPRALEQRSLDRGGAGGDGLQRLGRHLRRLLAESKVQLLNLRAAAAQHAIGGASARRRGGGARAQRVSRGACCGAADSGADSGASPGARASARAAPGTHVLDQLVDLVGAGALGRHQVVQVEAQRANLAAQLRARAQHGSTTHAWSASERLRATAGVRVARSCRRGRRARDRRARIGRACACARRNGRMLPSQAPANVGVAGAPRSAPASSTSCCCSRPRSR